jgi:flavin-dependent dehydrogenase
MRAAGTITAARSELFADSRSRPPERFIMKSIETQVAIVGGGPAGSSLAGFLRQRGIDCVIFEREKFPRFHVGESLLPENIRMLEKLGCLEKAQSMGFIRKAGATFVYDRPDEKGEPVKPAIIWFKDARFNSPPAAINVKRAEFDDMLLRHAVSLGAGLHEETSVSDVIRGDDGMVNGLRATTKDGEAIECRAKFVADCTGQGAWLAKKMGVWSEDPTGHAKAAFFAHYENVRRDPPPADGNIVLIFAPGRWYWHIPFTGPVTSVGVVVNRELLTERWKGDVTAFFDDMMTDSPEALDRIKDAKRISPVNSIQNYAYECKRYSGDGWVLVGDAAAFVDPVFSTGTSIAMRGAGFAAECIADGLQRGDRSGKVFASYEKRIRKAQRFFKPYIYGWYTRPFQRVFREPRNVLGVMPPMISMLAGDAYSPFKRFAIKCWTWIFWLAVWGEKRKLMAEEREAAKMKATAADSEKAA